MCGYGCEGGWVRQCGWVVYIGEGCFRVRSCLLVSTLTWFCDFFVNTISASVTIPMCLLVSTLTWFCDFFVNTISAIRDNLNFQTMPLPPVTHIVFDGSPLTAFHPVSESIVREVMYKNATKSCELEPLPSSLLAELIDDLLPSFTSVINDAFDRQLSFCVQIRRCQAVEKKSSLDTESLRNYRPVSNLPFLSKITEKIVLLQLSLHRESNNLLYPLQSAYRLGHSTETALFKL